MSAAQPATPTEACQQKVRDDLVLRTLTELEPPEAVDSEQGTTVTGAIDTIHGKLRYHCGVRRVGEQWHVDLFLEAI